jgi:hypothetical protein
MQKMRHDSYKGRASFSCVALEYRTIPNSLTPSEIRRSYYAQLLYHFSHYFILIYATTLACRYLSECTIMARTLPLRGL